MIRTITGDNDDARAKLLAQYTSRFITEHGDIALERLDGDEHSFEQIQEALQSLPFLATHKMVVLKSGAMNKQFTESAETLLTNLPETTELILVEPKLDKRSSYYKFLKAETEFLEQTTPDERGLAKWLVDAAKKQQGTINQSDALYLVERVGANQLLLSNELEKLLLYNPNISRQTIELLTEAAPQSTIFELVEAAFAGKTAKALQLYDEQRSLKVEAPQIIAMLTWQLHILALVTTAGDRPPEAIAREAKISPYTVKKTAQLARNVSRSTVKRQTEALLQIDWRSKQAAIDLDDALKQFIITLGI